MTEEIYELLKRCNLINEKQTVMAIVIADVLSDKLEKVYPQERFLKSYEAYSRAYKNPEERIAKESDLENFYCGGL